MTSPNIVATGRGIVSPRGKGSPTSRGRGYTSNAAAAAAAVALPKATDIPKGAVKTVTLTAGGIIKRAVPQGRIAVTTSITATEATSPTVTPNSIQPQIKEGEQKVEASNDESSKQIEEALPDSGTDDKKDALSPNKSPTLNGTKSNNTTTPNSRGRGRGNNLKNSPLKSISSPTHEKDSNDSSDSPVKDGPKIIRLKSNSVTEVIKSNSSPSANSSPLNDDIASKTNSTPIESNKRKAVPSTPTNSSNLESPASGSSESRSKRQRKEKKIFDL